jgi:hypothetical protein
MSGYVITLGHPTGGARAPLGRDVIASWWGPGHEFSYCDGRTLTLVVEVAARSRADAFEAVLAKLECIWSALTGVALSPPTTVRVEVVVPRPELVLAEVIGRSSDRVALDGMLAEATASRCARLRAAVAALGELDSAAG